MIDPALRDIPAIRKLAEDAESAYQTVLNALSDINSPWAHLDDEQRGRRISARVTLLTDLTRPDSRDAVARLVADRIGWAVWNVMLAVENGGSLLAKLYRECGLREDTGNGRDPAEALRLIALAVLR